MPYRVLVIVLFVFSSVPCFAQLEYTFKADFSFINFRYHTINIDPGPNWQGYYLSGQNGMSWNMVHGVAWRERTFLGVGLSYLQFQDVPGMAAYLDVSHLLLKRRLSPMTYGQLGFSHLWNQYEKGTNTALAEIGIGLNYKIKGKKSVYLKTGGMATQQSWMHVFGLGLRI